MTKKRENVSPELKTSQPPIVSKKNEHGQNTVNLAKSTSDVTETSHNVNRSVNVSQSGFIVKRILKVTKPLVKGEDVKAVQKALIASGFHCGENCTTGVYGAQTAHAVRQFQAMNRLIVSGQVEKFTTIALGGTWKD